jgi:E3 ubiquitin-protein ligase RNF13
MKLFLFIKGYITLANPIGACSKIEKPLNVSFVDPDKWIVLIQRTPTIFGNCSFDLKVYNAQQAGFKAVIIYNSESDNLIKMSSSGLYKIKIPSVFIGHSSGIDIASYFTYANKTYVIITDDDTDLNYLLLPFICVVTICFIIAISIFVCFQ